MKSIILFTFLLFYCHLSNSQSWFQSYTSNNTSYTDIQFLNQNTGYCSSSYSGGFIGNGGVIKSTNGGSNWVGVYNGVPIQSIYFINDNTGWIAGGYWDDMGRKSREIFKTTNGGQNFTRQYLDSLPYIFRAVQFMSQDAGYVLTRNGILYTSNSGANWITRNLPADNSGAMFFVNQFTGYVSGYLSGSQTNLYKTTNAGLNWTTEALDGIVADIFFANENTGWVISNAGKIYKTTDGWNSRTSIDLSLSNMSSIFFYGASTGWMCGGNGQMYYTNNGGANWTLQNTGTTSGLRNIFFTDSNTGWVLGGQYVSPVLIIASIHKTTNGGISAISNISSEVPAEYSLSQNYPNPFNPTTNFEFRIAGLGFVNLTIYDAMGRVVEILQNGNMKPGVYQAQWNAAEYPSGVYFYRLSANGFNETKKMILTK